MHHSDALGTLISVARALLGTRVRRLLVAWLYPMQLGFWALMGVAFPPCLFCSYLFWVPWDRHVVRISRRTAAEDHEFTIRAARPGG
jgi:hypothetical protein